MAAGGGGGSGGGGGGVVMVAGGEDGEVRIAVIAADVRVDGISIVLVKMVVINWVEVFLAIILVLLRLGLHHRMGESSGTVVFVVVRLGLHHRMGGDDWAVDGSSGARGAGSRGDVVDDDGTNRRIGKGISRWIRRWISVGTSRWVCRGTVGQNQVVLRHKIIHFPMYVREPMDKCSGRRRRSEHAEQGGASE